jgi:hypothetical protein
MPKWTAQRGLNAKCVNHSDLAHDSKLSSLSANLSATCIQTVWFARHWSIRRPARGIAGLIERKRAEDRGSETNRMQRQGGPVCLARQANRRARPLTMPWLRYQAAFHGRSVSAPIDCKRLLICNDPTQLALRLCRGANQRAKIYRLWGARRITHSVVYSAP